VGETALAVGLWAAGVAAVGDLVIASLLLAAAFGVSVLAIIADPRAGQSRKALLLVIISVFFAGSEGIVAWRHVVDGAGADKEAEKAGYTQAQRDQAIATMNAMEREQVAASKAPTTKKEVVRALKAGNF
jgi:hypothetical protein